MLSQKLLQKNSELWSTLHPQEALLLPYQDPQKISPILAANGELDLMGSYPLHGAIHPSQSARDWLSTLHLENTKLLYIFGVGLGYYYKVLLPWLRGDKKRRVLFLEHDPEVLYYFFQTKTATELLKDPQVALHYFSDLHHSEEVFEQIYWDHAMEVPTLSSLDSYRQNNPRLTEELHHKLIYEVSVKNALVEEYLHFGANFFRNYYANILYLHEAYLGNQLFDKFPSIPAIICGAGPSLDKALPLLKQLQHRAILFAGGSSLNALCKAHLLPHFGCGIDPNSTQLERLSSSSAYELPFFYRNRLLHQALRTIHGPHLFITGAGGYDIAEWYEERLHLPTEWLDEGHNVVNFCTQIATRMGCNPILFVGVDLGYTDDKPYAEGVTTTPDPEEEEILLRNDIYGNPLRTLWKWIAEANWIGDYAREHPKTQFINATEGGLGFPSIPNISLQRSVEEHLTHSYDLHGLIHTEIQNSSLDITYEQIEHITRQMESSLKRSIQHIDTLVEEAEILKKKITREKGEPHPLQSGLSALAETELNEEPAYDYILDIFHQVYSRILNPELQTLNKRRLTQKSRMMKKIDLNIRRLSFLRDIARVNLATIDLAFRAKKLGHMPTLEELEREEPERVPPPPLIHYSPPPSSPSTYRWEEGQLLLVDPSLDLHYEAPFTPLLQEQPLLPRYSRHTLSHGDILRARFFLLDGKLEGEWQWLYPTGELQGRSFYLRGELHGPSTFYTREGTLLSQQWFLHGKRWGTTRQYYFSHPPYAIQHFLDDHLQGTQEFFYPTTPPTPKSLLHYDKGKLCGHSRLFHPDGTLKTQNSG